MSWRNRPLVVHVENGEIVIRIGIDTLAFAVENSEKSHHFDESLDEYFRHFSIDDNAVFADDVIAAMLREEENGATKLSDFFDRMADDAMDDGSTACNYDRKIKWGEKQ